MYIITQKLCLVNNFFIFFLHMTVSSANNLCNYYISVDCSCQQIYEIILLYFYNWYRLEESNSYSHFRRVLYYPLYEDGMAEGGGLEPQPL